jgi:hypothetical protein
MIRAGYLFLLGDLDKQRDAPQFRIGSQPLIWESEFSKDRWIVIGKTFAKAGVVLELLDLLLKE